MTTSQFTKREAAWMARTRAAGYEFEVFSAASWSTPGSFEPRLMSRYRWAGDDLKSSWDSKNTHWELPFEMTPERWEAPSMHEVKSLLCLSTSKTARPDLNNEDRGQLDDIYRWSVRIALSADVSRPWFLSSIEFDLLFRATFGFFPSDFRSLEVHRSWSKVKPRPEVKDEPGVIPPPPPLPEACVLAGQRLVSAEEYEYAREVSGIVGRRRQ